MSLTINDISLLKIILSSLLFSAIITSVIEGYNWYSGFENFSTEREISIFITNFIIGLFASYFHFKKKKRKQRMPG